MRIAIYQGSGVFLDTVANLKLMNRLANAARYQDAKLLILPELFLTGYNLGDDARRLCEPADGPSAKQAQSIAQEHEIALLYGYPEWADDKIFNSAILIDDCGKRVANYRKTHLFGPEERRIFSAGDEIAVAGCGDLKVGILICYDLEFPELVRSVALAGADLIAVPTAISPPYYEIPTTIVRARAYENQLFVAYVNRTGEERDLGFFGMSGVVAPDGKDLVRAGAHDASLMVATIDPAAYEDLRRYNTYFRDRRPALYHAVIEEGAAKQKLMRRSAAE